MADSYGALITAILDDIHRSNYTSQVETAISGAVNRLSTERFHFNEGVRDFTTSPSVPDYTLSTVAGGLIKLDSLKISVGGSQYVLKNIDWETLESRDSGQAPGQPRRWAVHHEILRLYPVPSLSYPVVASGLVACSATVWAQQAFNLVRAEAETEIFLVKLWDSEGAQRSAQWAKAERDILLSRGNMRRDGNLKGYL